MQANIAIAANGLLAFRMALAASSLHNVLEASTKRVIRSPFHVWATFDRQMQLIYAPIKLNGFRFLSSRLSHDTHTAAFEFGCCQFRNRFKRQHFVVT